MFNDKLTKSVADAVRQCISEEQKETQVQLNESKYTETKDKQGKMKSWKYEGDWEDSKEKKEGRGKVTHMSDAARRASEKMKNDDENVKEEVELTESELEEMSGAGWSAQKVHGHLKKSGWTLARTGGGHDVFTHPKAKNHIAVPRHKGDLKAPLVQGILKTVKMTTEAVEQIDEISKETLGSYIRKASGDRASATRAAGVEAGARGPNRWARMDAKEKRAEKRGVGISKAVDRLTKEELEEGLFPGTPEYEKKFGKVPQEMKQGQKKKTHQGEMEKTGKGVVHRRSFREMVELYQVEGVKGLFEEISVMQEESSEEEFNAELKKQKDKAEGKAPQADVAAAATQGTKDMKEEVEELDETPKVDRGLSGKQKVSARAARGDNDMGLGIGNTSGGQARHREFQNVNVAKSGERKGMITKAAITKTKDEIKSRLNKEEVDQLDETKEKEQLDELSKDKLGWYLRKASKHMDKKGENMIKRDKKFNPGYNKLSREIGGVSQRMASIAQASRKYMKKEEVEPETKEKECLVNDKNKGIGSFKKCQVERPDADFM